jgi:hypothetical protein
MWQRERGDEGHKIVCEIAFRLAQPDKRAAVRKLIRSDTEFDTFSESCVFPDHPRKRASEHFINLARNSQGLTSDECPQAEKCVLSAILNDSKILASNSAKKADRLIALKFLGHWVGDIHQPLIVRGRSRRQQHLRERKMFGKAALYVGYLSGGRHRRHRRLGCCR